MPPGGRCESDEGSADDLGDGDAGEASNKPDGAGVGEHSDSADGIPSECDGDDSVGTGLPRKESRPLILSRIDNFCFGIVDEAIARRR